MWKSVVIVQFLCGLESFNLTLILLTWKIWWAPNNTSRWDL